MKLNVAALAFVVAGGVCAAWPAMAQGEITGAGGTFPAPIYAKWGEAARNVIGVQLNYQAVGSGNGQAQIVSRSVDFGASDAPMEAARLASANLLQFPTVMGAVVPVVNLPGITTNQLKLSGPVLADIYLGKITRWNDPVIARLNAGVSLPNLAIAPVYRTDGSGTTYVFTSYLSAINPDWKSGVGASTSVKWAAGIGARGNEGVAGTIKTIRGSIGYVENAFATQSKLTTTQMQNKAGQFVEPTMEAFQAAAANGDWKGVQNFAVDLNNQAGAASWPIMSATFVLLPKDPKDPARSASVMKFMDWAYKDGSAIATELHYVPLPQAVQDSVRAAWRGVVANGQPVFK